MTTRLVILGMALVLGVAAAWLLERVRPRPGLEPGVTLVTGESCPLCPLAERALSEAGVGHRTVAASATVGIRSVPTLVVVDESGTVVVRRSGRAVIADAGKVAAWMAS
jgi:hypothetical protein